VDLLENFAHFSVPFALTYQDFQRAFGAGLHADIASDALEGHQQVVAVEHGELGAETDAAQAANALLPVNAHHAVLIAVDGVGGAHIDAFAALSAHNRVEGVEVVVDADGGFEAVVSPEICLGTGQLARAAACAYLLLMGEDFHQELPFLRVIRLF